MDEKYGKFYEVEGSFADDLKFLSAAIGTDTCRGFMNCLLIEPSDIHEDGIQRLKGITTDGARMHIVDPLPMSSLTVHNMKPGKYRIIKTARKNVQICEYPGAPGTFPEYKRVIPQEAPTWERKYIGDSFGRKAFSIEVSKLSNIEGIPCALDIEFLRPLAGYSWKIGFYKNEHQPEFISKVVVFKSGTRTAYLMPLAI